MSREIKFRAFYKGKMYIVYCLQFVDDFDEPLNYEAAQIRYNGEWLWIEKDVYVLSEFTGLKDCKRTKEFPEGQEIYEGDKLEYIYKKVARQGIVVERGGSWMLDHRSSDAKFNNGYLSIYPHRHMLKVIGRDS